VIAIAAFNQLSGINAVLYYAPAVFRMAGSGQDAALLQSVLVGGSNLVFTLLAMALIDRFGRRRLMLVGSLGYIVSLASTAWAFYRYGTDFDEFGGRLVLVSILAFIGAHAFGQGAVIWVFISEIFPNRRPGAWPGARQLHPLVHGSRDLVDVPHDRPCLRWPRLRLLRRDDGPAARLGAEGHARDEGGPPRGDPEAARHRLSGAPPPLTLLLWEW